MQANSKSWIHRLKGQDTLAQFIRGSGGGFAIKILSTLVVFASTTSLTRLLGKEEWGAYAFAISCLSIFLIVARYGFNKSAIRYVSSYRSLKSWGLLKGFIKYSHLTSFKVALSISFGMAIIVYFTGPIMKEYYGDDAFYNCLLISLVFLPFVARLEIQEGILDGFRRVVLSQLSMRTLRPAFIAVALICIYYFTSIGRFTREAGDIVLHAELAIIINLIATILAVALSFFLVKSTLPKEVDRQNPSIKRRSGLSHRKI